MRCSVGASAALPAVGRNVRISSYPQALAALSIRYVLSLCVNSFSAFTNEHCAMSVLRLYAVARNCANPRVGVYLCKLFVGSAIFALKAPLQFFSLLFCVLLKFILDFSASLC